MYEHLKIRPNDPCPCGSGKKYKKCCRGKEDFSDNIGSLFDFPQYFAPHNSINKTYSYLKSHDSQKLLNAVVALQLNSRKCRICSRHERRLPD